jgi:hypothetical protein
VLVLELALPQGRLIAYSHVTERFPVSLAAAASAVLVVLAITTASWTGDGRWLFLGGLSIALGSVGMFFGLRHRKWFAATANLVSALAGVWMVIVIATFEGR